MAEDSARRSNRDIERRLLTMVDQALELPPNSREGFLSDACGDDSALLKAARDLLASCLRAAEEDVFLRDPAALYAESIIRAVDANDPAHPSDFAASVMDALRTQYEFVREIGRGGNAIVYLARDLRHGRDVAIKVIRQETAAPSQRTRFVREIAIAAQLRHPHVVSLIDSGEAGGALFYVMPFIEGESLRQRLDREGALPMTTVLALARDVAEALDFAHAKGIVHRDIKPQNILLSSAHALVADFGIALALEATGAQRVTERGVAVGTPVYMSPEQASASDRIDGRSDVYSLGCVVYEMLAGEVPFPGETPHAVRAKHLHAPVPDVAILRPALHPAVQHVMSRALAKVPAERFATAGEFVEALGAAATGAIPRRAWKRPVTIIATLVTVAIVSLGTWRVMGARGRTPAPTAGDETAANTTDRRRIAVLYFDNLSSDAEVGSIARGLTEDLIDELSQVRGLRVISPNGVRPYRDRQTSIDSIAGALGVGTVVGGSISASAKVVRASVRLIDPATGEQLQSRSFEEPRSDALELRQAVVTQVAEFLRERLGQEIRLRQQRSETRSLAAWEVVQRAEELARDGAEASNQAREADAIDLLNRADSLYAVAQRLDPTWIGPTIGRGWVAVRLSLATPASALTTSPVLVSPAEVQFARMMRRALSYAEKAVASSGGSAEALALRGFARAWMATSGSPSGADTLARQAEADLRAALGERPDDATSWFALGDLLERSGRHAEAALALGNAYDADAYLTEVRAVVSQLFFVSLSLERFDEARRWCALGNTRYAGDPRFATCRLILLGWSGRTGRDVAEAWREIADIERVDSTGTFASQWGFFRSMVAVVAARAGMADSARSILRAVHAAEAAHPASLPFRESEAYAHLLMGERNDAAQLLGEQLRAYPPSREAIMRSPWFRDLVADPRLGAYFGVPARAAPNRD